MNHQPHEALPKALHGFKDEASELTEFFVRSAYADQKFDEQIYDRLRRFWITFRRIRNRVVR